jgi:hypothetical protein
MRASFRIASASTFAKMRSYAVPFQMAAIPLGHELFRSLPEKSLR